MAGLETLAAPVVMGAFLVIVAGVLSRRAHRRSAPERHRTQGGGLRIGRWLRSPRAWSVGFIILVVGAVGAALLIDTGAVATAFVGGLAALIVGYLVYGTYASVRARGAGAAQAVAAAAWMLGLLAVVAIAAQLLLSS